VGASRVSISGGRVLAAFPSINLAGWMQLLLALGLSLGARHSTQAQARPPVQINTNVELVQVPVIVFDDKGGVASNLKKDDFRIFEDGVEQRILHCERERESVSFIILDDLSSSMTRKIPFVQEATLSVLDSDAQQDRYKDEFSVYGIASRARRLIPFTRDQKDLERRLPWLLTPTNGSTALFDGIYLGISEAREQAENKRRAMIIISDGETIIAAITSGRRRVFWRKPTFRCLRLWRELRLSFQRSSQGRKRNQEYKGRRRFQACLRVRKTLSDRQNDGGRATFRPSRKRRAAAFLRPSTRRIFRGSCGPSALRCDTGTSSAMSRPKNRPMPRQKERAARTDGTRSTWS